MLLQEVHDRDCTIKQLARQYESLKRDTQQTGERADETKRTAEELGATIQGIRTELQATRTRLATMVGKVWHQSRINDQITAKVCELDFLILPTNN